MSFTPNLLSQRDPRWADEKLGFDPSVTIGSGGDALTCLAMLVDGFGFNESPATLNNKLKDLGTGVGFVKSLIVWPGLASAFPGIVYQRAVICRDSSAPLSDINASIDAGQPLLVEIDRSPVLTLQNHWLLVYARQSDDYLVLDPYPLPPDDAPVGLISRYGVGRDPAGFITTVVWYEVISGPSPAPRPAAVSAPAAPISTGSSQSFTVRVLESIGSVGLRLRDRPDADAGTLAVLSAGEILEVLDAPDLALPRIGEAGQWLQVRTPANLTGYVAAWFVERTDSGESVIVPQSAFAAASMTVVVAGATGLGLRLRDGPNATSRVLKVLSPGTPLAVVEPASSAAEKIGAKNRWLNVREPGGVTGFVAAWYVVK